MHEIEIKIGETPLYIIGNYFKEEEEVGLPERFEVTNIQTDAKDLYDILEYSNSLSRGEFIKVVEELVLEDIMRNG